MLLRLSLSVASVKHILVKLSAVVALVLINTIVSGASRSLEEQFKSTGAVSIYPALSSQFNVHSIPQRNSKTTPLHLRSLLMQLQAYRVYMFLAYI